MQIDWTCTPFWDDEDVDVNHEKDLSKCKEKGCKLSKQKCRCKNHGKTRCNCRHRMKKLRRYVFLEMTEYLKCTHNKEKVMMKNFKTLLKEITKLKKELRGMSSILISIWFKRGFKRSLISL